MGSGSYDVDVAAAPLFMSAYALGLMTTTSSCKPSFCRATVASALYSTVATIFSITCLFSYILLFHSMNIFTRTFLFLINVSFCSSIAMLIGLHISMFFQSEKISKLLTEFGNLCETTLDAQKICNYLYWKVRLAFVMGGILFLSFNITSSILMFPMSVKCAVLDFFSTLIATMLVFVISGQVVFFTYLLKCFFADVNRQFQTIVYFQNKDKAEKYPAIPDDALAAQVRSLALRHGALCSIACHFNAVYTLPLLLVIAYSYVHVVFGAYVALWGTLRGDAPDEALGLRDVMRALSIGWLCYFFSVLSCVVAGCRYAAQQANLTVNYVHRLLTYNFQLSVRNELELFSMQLLHQRVQFTACGLFPLDFSLLHSVVGAVASYLILLVQFQLSLSEDTADNENIVNQTLTNVTSFGFTG